ncbi:hypothetical protein HMN09_00727800 [Mycena chlorophos]|uniref:F-box domain-containing protein n=1 Tax=Mycena chlorophos TaxID=658473 RepID=A0A8H6W4S9_MYCCL|nr:hypothetical protein HMN09_00727800 [Mycena chlorophos]
MAQLPTELIALICTQSNDHATVASLCRVARRFVAPAQDHLFRTVDLEEKPLRILRSWCSTVAKHRVLAERVHALSLQLPGTLAFMSADVEKVSKALKACKNLKELRVTNEMSGRVDSMLEWLVSKAPFMLTKFTNSYFHPSYLDAFFARQADLQVLAVPFGGSFPADIVGDKLPNLIAVSASLDSIPTDRPVQRIETPYQHNLSHLAYFSKTLTTLSLISYSTERRFFEGALNLIHEAVPQLVHLSLVQRRRTSTFLPWAIETPAARLKRFKKLQTFTLVTRNILNFARDGASGTIDKMYEAKSPENLRELAAEILEACPTMRRVVIGTEVKPEPELLYTATRSSEDGEVKGWLENEIDLRRISMFWAPTS